MTCVKQHVQPSAASLHPRDAELSWIDPHDPESRRRWIQLGLVLLLTILAYLPTFSAGFLWLDDRVIADNPSLRSKQSLWHTWTHPRATLPWRPLADSLLYPQHALWGTWNPGGYHAVGLSLHLLNVTLVWLLLRRLSIARPLAGAALFALHPIAVHTVAWSAQQPILLATGCALLALIAWTNWIESRHEPDDDRTFLERPTPLATAVICFVVAGLLADARIVCTLPVVMAMLVRWRMGALDRRCFVFASALLVVSVAITCLAWGEPSHPAKSIGSFHVFKLAVPFPLLISYAKDSPSEYLWLLSTIGITTSIFALRKRLPREWSLAAIAFFVLLLPAALLDSVSGDAFVADPQQYFAAIPLLAAVGAVLPSIATIAVAVLLGGLTLLQARHCESNTLAWQHVRRHQPDSRLALVQLGDYQRLVELHPRDADALLLLGDDFLARDDTAAAKSCFDRAAEARPDDPRTLRRLAAVAARQGNPQEAVTLLRRGLELDPHDAVSRNNLAALYVQFNRHADAIREFEQALRDDPRSADTHVNLARVYFAIGRGDESSAHLHDAVRIDPQNFNAYMTAGDLLMKLNDPRQASRMLRQAVKLRRDSAEAFNLLGVSLIAQNQLSEAIYCFNKALDLQPDFASARNNLALAQAQRDAEPSTRP